MNEFEIPRVSGQIAVLADLHLDHYRKHGIDWFARHRLADLPWERLDALIIAGDVVNDPVEHLAAALQEVARYIDPGKIVFLPGNHDYYFHAIDAEHELAEIVEAAVAHFAQKSEITYGIDRFLCATLWTDFALQGDVKRGMRAVHGIHNDYRLIRIRGDNPGWLPDMSALPGLLSPEIVAEVHRDHRAWLAGKLSEESSGRTVVVTHHCPHPDVMGPLFSFSAAYASNLGELISTYQPEAWFFGHTHHRIRKRIGATDFRNVSLGYPGEAHFDSRPGVTTLCRWW